MALYDDMDELLKKNLLTCLKHNKLEQYLFGKSGLCLREMPGNEMPSAFGGWYFCSKSD